MRVEITVKVNDQLVKSRSAEVAGTLEQMEEAIHALGKQVANDSLQASVQAVISERPLFLHRAGSFGTRDMSRGH